MGISTYLLYTIYDNWSMASLNESYIAARLLYENDTFF